MTVGAEQNEDNPCVVEAVSNNASGEAGFDGLVIEGGEKNATNDSIGCHKVEGVKAVKSISRSVKKSNESSLCIE